MTRRTAVPSILLLATVAWASGCSDNVAPAAVSGRPAAPADSLVGLTVSQPISGLGGAAVSASRTSAAAASGASVVYVSLVPGTVPAGVQATVLDQASGLSVTTVLVNGGFDPIGIPAGVGDTLIVEITRRGNAGPLRVSEAVRAKQPPVVVRTGPPTGGRDVPLNTALVIVFSDPVDSSTLSTSTVQLRQGSTAVPGSVVRDDSSGVRIRFQPDAPLDAQTSYDLVVTPAIRDVNGLALDSAVAVSFTTGSQAVAGIRLWAFPDPGTFVTGAAVTVVAEVTDTAGQMLDPALDPPLTWSASDSTVVRIDSLRTGEVAVSALSAGTATITAKMAGGVSGSLALTVLPSLSGSGYLAVRDFAVVEHQYPGSSEWFYAPVVQVQAVGGVVDILKLAITIPGFGTNESCGSRRLDDLLWHDLNPLIYGDYSVEVDFPGRRATSGEPATAVITYRNGNGTLVDLTLTGPVVETLPTPPETYNGPGGLWGDCYSGSAPAHVASGGPAPSATRTP